MVSQKVLICHPELVSGSRNQMLNRVQHDIFGSPTFYEIINIPIFPYSNGKQALYSIKKGRMER